MFIILRLGSSFTMGECYGFKILYVPISSHVMLAKIIYCSLNFYAFSPWDAILKVLTLSVVNTVSPHIKPIQNISHWIKTFMKWGKGLTNWKGKLLEWLYILGFGANNIS